MKSRPVETFLTGTAFDPAASIVQERDTTRNFISILEQEQHALQQADVSLLLPLVKEKTGQAQQLAALADTRNQWLAKLGYSRDRSGMERGLKDCTPGAAAAWGELLQLAETASQLNKINGVLIAQRLRYNHQALTVLQAATHGAGLYGADGQPQLFSGGRQLSEG
jgi:flagellar biosynthesis protein FlgN